MTSALNSKASLNFKKELNKALTKQILEVAEVEKISGITKRLNKVSKNLLLMLGVIWLSLDEAIDGGKDRIYDYMLWSGNKGGESALDKMIPFGEFNLKDKDLKDKLMDRVDFLVRTVDKTGMKLTAKIISDALDQKLSAVEITKYLREKAKAISQERAEMITDTETAYAMGLVETETFKRNGIKKHYWVVVEDERLCSFCMANEAAGAIAIGKEFPSGATAPPQHQSCRCFLLPVLPITIKGKVWMGD